MKEIYSKYENAVINYLENIYWSVTPESEKSTYTALKNNFSCRFRFYYENAGTEMPRMLRIDSGERQPENHVKRWRFYNEALSGASDGDDTLLGFQLASGNNWNTAIFIIKDSELCESDFVKYGCPLFEEFTADDFSWSTDIPRIDSFIQTDSLRNTFKRISLFMFGLGFIITVALWEDKGRSQAIIAAIITFITYIFLLIYFTYDHLKNKTESKNSPLREKYLFLIEQADPSIVMTLKKEKSGLFCHLPCLIPYGDEFRVSSLPVYHYTFTIGEGLRTVIVQFFCFNISNGIIVDSVIIPDESASIMVSNISINGTPAIFDSFVFNNHSIINGEFSTKLSEILNS
ncbi:hypothetical protein KKF34_00460 [Myxococcota bacterium]|nr:hypothetical protein [Myxococcota bacterium]MBU1382025.1 hypothetical protein [Myxococcota bacterium]MBU1495333.1 hypothetical protein [Myxococcota bacterium]